jgi:hypothetical protein
LFLSSLNLWGENVGKQKTTLFFFSVPLAVAAEDFCTAGAIVHAFLPQVFKAAFGAMAFKEFPEADHTADPRIVETISWHAINGKRLQSSMDFLQHEDSSWSVRLLSVAMEPTRILIYFWMSCIGKSLQAGQRPMLYCLLDPRCSVVMQALQHYAAFAHEPDRRRAFASPVDTFIRQFFCRVL